MKAAISMGSVLVASLALGQTVPGVLVVQATDKSEIIAAARKIHESNNRPIKPPKNAPGVRIDQAARFDPKEFEQDLVLVPLEEICAQEVDDDGRLTPVSWAMSDPIFRVAVEDKLLSFANDAPSMDEMRGAMGKLKTGYLFVVTAFAANGEVWTQAKLFRGSREVWKDEVRSWQSEVSAQYDADNAKRSIARTWVQVIGSGPLKDLVPRKKATDETQNLAPLQANTAPPPKPAVDNKQLLIDAMRLLSSKQTAEAVNLLRDAVDAEPLDAERREALISALSQAGEPALAAEEARRAAALMPERVEFWLSAARAWIVAGRPEEAVSDLNEAVARDPEGPATRTLLAEAQLAQGRFEMARDHLSVAIEKSSSAYTLRLRAFAHGALGMPEPMAKDLAAADVHEQKESETQHAMRARLMLTSSIRAFEGMGQELRTAIQALRRDPKDEAAGISIGLAATRVATLGSLLSANPLTQYKNATDQLLLAQNLLGLSVAGLQKSFGSRDEDALTDATIDLGEALKAMAAAKEALQKTG